MATANTLAAVEAGAESVDVTVGGLGERAGNAALEEIVMALRVSCGIDCGVRTEALTDLCRLVAEAAGQPIPRRKPSSAPTLHARIRHPCPCALRDKRAYEPFAACDVGGAGTQFVLGKHSGNTHRTSTIQRQSFRRFST